MAKEILKCPLCNKYTLKKEHCEKTISIKPPKYSPLDKWGSLRRKYKEKIKKKEKSGEEKWHGK